MSEEKTLGETYWDAYAEGHTQTWTGLSEKNRASVERGLQAVLERVGALECTPLASEPATPLRYALVEQMGHRSTVATVREVTFCGEPMLEVTDLRDQSAHLVSPKSLYEVTWLTEGEARDRVQAGARARAWTAQAITTGNPNPWGAYGADDYDDGSDEAENDEGEAPGKGPDFPTVAELGGERFAAWPSETGL